ncbi:hypothetical protein C8Q80DRAFT_1265426 [Daedaleopsis nitida]|nr:hypothetical protein C8Q80DRAFT_1265426 [Daedaleopsis nitida]
MASDQTTTSVGDNFEVKQAVSQNGVPFEVIARKKEIPAESESAAEDTPAASEAETVASLGNFADINVPYWKAANWSVGDNKWVKTANTPAAEVCITQYKLYYNGCPNIFSYTLDFTVTSDGECSFMDETGDVYNVSIVYPGDHSVKYNSDKPTVVAVKRT